MTAPINFATIQAPQLAPPRRSQLDGFAEFVASLAEQRDARAVRREQLATQRDQHETNKELDALTKRQKLKELEIADLREQAAELVAPDVLEFMALGAKGDEVAALEISRRRQAANKNAKLVPYINEAYASGIKGGQEGVAAVAQRRANEAGAITAGVNARIATNTEAAKTEAGNLEPDVQRAQLSAARSQLENSKIERELSKLRLASFGTSMDRQGATLFDSLLNTGLNAGQIADLTNTPLPKSIPRDYTRAPKASATDDNEDMASTLILANAGIKGAKNQRIGLPGRVSMEPGTGIMSTIVKYGATAAAGSDQQVLATNYMTYASSLNRLINSARATNQDFDRILTSSMAIGPDSDDAVANKAIIRDLIPAVFQAKARGIPESVALSDVIAEARKRKVNPALLIPFVDLQKKLAFAEKTPTDSVSRNKELLNGIIRP